MFQILDIQWVLFPGYIVISSGVTLETPLLEAF